MCLPSTQKRFCVLGEHTRRVVCVSGTHIRASCALETHRELATPQTPLLMRGGCLPLALPCFQRKNRQNQAGEKLISMGAPLMEAHRTCPKCFQSAQKRLCVLGKHTGRVPCISQANRCSSVCLVTYTRRPVCFPSKQKRFCVLEKHTLRVLCVCQAHRSAFVCLGNTQDASCVFLEHT